MNNLSSTIVDVWDYKDGTLHILVDAEYAESLHKFLKDNGTQCHPLSKAIFQGTKFFRDKNGMWNIEQPCTAYAFETECLPDALNNVTARND